MLGTITWDGLRQDTRHALWRTLQALNAATRPGQGASMPEDIWLSIKKFMGSDPTELSSELERQALLLWVNETRRTLVAKIGGASAARDAETTDILAELIVLQAKVKALTVTSARESDASP